MYIYDIRFQATDKSTCGYHEWLLGREGGTRGYVWREVDGEGTWEGMGGGVGSNWCVM